MPVSSVRNALPKSPLQGRLKSNENNCLCESTFYHALNTRQDGCYGGWLVLLIITWEKMLIIIKAVTNCSSSLWHKDFSEPEKPFSIMD